MRFLSLFFLLVSFTMSVSGQVKQPRADSVVLISPYHSILNHLHFLQKETYRPRLAAQSLAATPQLSAEKRERLAIQLKQILDGKGIFVVLKNLPQQENYYDSLAKSHVYTITSQFPEIYLVKLENNWVYSEETLENIPRLHKQVYPWGADKLVNAVPQSWHSSFLGLEIWQFFGLMLLIVLSWMLYKLVLIFTRRLIISTLKKYNQGFTQSEFVIKVARPFSWFLIFQICTEVYPLLQFPIFLGQYVVLFLQVIVPLFGILVFYHTINLLGDFFKRLAAKTEGTLDDQLVPLVTKSLKVFVVLIGVIYILVNLGVDVKPYLAGISIGGLAFALAAQDTIKNLFGSFMIFVDKPFQIGDWINYNGLDGTVEEVGFRSTRVRTFYNSLITIPNSKLADGNVDNFGLRVYRRYNTKLSITYDTPPMLIEAFVDGLREIVKAHPTTRKDYYEIHLNDLADSSIQILFYIFFEVPTWSAELKGRHEVISSILQLAKKLNVRFAFPTQTLHIEDFPEKKSITPVYNLNKNQLKVTIDDFLNQRDKK